MNTRQEFGEALVAAGCGVERAQRISIGLFDWEETQMNEAALSALRKVLAEPVLGVESEPEAHRHIRCDFKASAAKMDDDLAAKLQQRVNEAEAAQINPPSPLTEALRQEEEQAEDAAVTESSLSEVESLRRLVRAQQQVLDEEADARATFAIGYRRLITYTRTDESGSSLRGAGWLCIAKRPARSWNMPGRPRVDKSEPYERLLWEASNGVSPTERVAADEA